MLSLSPQPRRTGLPSSSAISIASGDQPNVVVGRDEKTRRPRRRIVNRLADFRIDHLDDGADNVPRRAELTKFTRLLYLPQHMLEQIALGIAIRLVEPQLVDLADHLRQYSRLVDAETRTVHEVHRGKLGDLRIEGKHFVAKPANQCLAVQPLRPDAPA